MRVLQDSPVSHLVLLLQDKFLQLFCLTLSHFLRPKGTKLNPS